MAGDPQKPQKKGTLRPLLLLGAQKGHVRSKIYLAKPKHSRERLWKQAKEEEVQGQDNAHGSCYYQQHPEQAPTRTPSPCWGK
jgi:hypothetical protein